MSIPTVWMATPPMWKWGEHLVSWGSMYMAPYIIWVGSIEPWMLFCLWSEAHPQSPPATPSNLQKANSMDPQVFARELSVQLFLVFIILFKFFTLQFNECVYWLLWYFFACTDAVVDLLGFHLNTDSCVRNHRDTHVKLVWCLLGCYQHITKLSTAYLSCVP